MKATSRSENMLGRRQVSSAGLKFKVVPFAMDLAYYWGPNFRVFATLR